MGRHGENIRKRKDGRWEARMIIRYDAEGKAKYRSFYGKTYLEAKEKRILYLESHQNHKPEKNDWNGRKVTVS